MEIHVLFGQRKQRYEGEYAPEAIAVSDEYSAEVNAEFLMNLKREHEQDGEFESLAIVAIKVSQAEIMKRLRPNVEAIQGKIVE